MLISLFVIPIFAYLLLFLLKPNLSKFLSIFGCLLIALFSLLGLFYAVWQTPLWNKGERIIWLGMKAKSNDMQIGGNPELSSIGWANESFAPKLNLTTRGNQLNLAISGGNGFVQELKSREFLNGVEIPLNASINYGNYSLKKTYNWKCGSSLDISQGDNLIVKIFLSNLSRTKVFNFDNRIENATQNLTINSEKRNEWLCQPNYLLNPAERVRMVEELKLFATDTRILVTETGEVRLLTPEMQAERQCEFPCRIKVFWANSSTSVELNRLQDKLTFKYLPPFRNFSPIPDDSEAKQQLIVTDQLKTGDFAYQLPLGKKETGIRKPLAFNTIQQSIPEPFEKVAQSFCEAPNCSSIEGKDYTYSFIKIKDLPSFTWIVIFTIFPLSLFVGGLILIQFSQMSLEMRCLVGALNSVVWNFLVFRLLLAIRFALNPAYLDQISIQDLTLSFVALAILPPLIFLIARIRSDSMIDDSTEAKTSTSLCLGYLVGIFIVAWGLIFYVQNLWTELPETFRFRLGWSYSLGLLALFIYLFFHIVFFYRIKQNISQIRIVKFLAEGIWNLPQELLPILRNFWRNFLTGERFLLKLFIIAAGYYSIFAAFLFISRIGLLAKDFLPLIFCLSPAFFWLAGKSVDQTEFEQSNQAWWRTFSIGCISFAPFILLPVFISDVGAIYANVFIFLSLFFILCKKSNGIRVFGWATGLLTLLGLVLVFGFILNFSSFIGSKFLGKTTPRVLAWKSGEDVQHYLLSSDAGSDTNQIGLKYYDVTNVYEHSWENQAIAHNGGFFGNGFGNAPDRLSQIPPSVIQVDSVFSFFIMGDYGWFGGMLLLLLYFAPLLIVFVFNRHRKFKVGFSMALIICIWFAFEGLLHASMVLGVLPFTGRNLPFLAVHSLNGDLLRWAMLFLIAVFMLFLNANDEIEEVCLLTHEDRSLKCEKIRDNNFKPVESNGKKPNFWDFVTYYQRMIFSGNLETWNQFGWLFSLKILLLIITAIYSFLYIYRNNSLETFTWEVLKKDIDFAVSQKMLIAVQDEKEKSLKCPKIVFNENIYQLKYTDYRENNSFLKQQVDRFNALSCRERIGEGVFPNVTANLEKVNNFDDYENFLDNLRTSDVAARHPKRPNLLAVRHLRKDQRNNSFGEFEVQFNPDFNIERTFNQPQLKEKIPSVKIGDKPLFGMAWNKGKYVIANDNIQVLAWSDWLAGSMSLEWERLGSTEALRKYGTLTLDERLHSQTLGFTDQKGILQHNSKLSEQTKSNEYQDKLPSRIGLTVMKITKKTDQAETKYLGEVLALGSFPRAVAGDVWQKLNYGQNTLLLPPAKLVEKRFPFYLKQLYGGDRNFEKVSVMGSSTKPMWAAAVLSVHYGIPLSGGFKVSGSEVNDDSVFGIKIAGDNERWKGHGSNSNLVDFDTFLTESNNRYQVLFGFLGLAESKEGQTNIPTENGVSNSNLEMMQGTFPWRKYPKFSGQIGFNFLQPDSISGLQNTELAMRVRRIFGVGTKERESSEDTEDFGAYLNSFWTKNENDDALRLLEGENKLPIINERIRKNFAPNILPARANFRLNKINKPRDFVTLLLGGGENQWSNVQVAAGFTTAVIGKPVLPSIVQNDDSPIFYGRSNDFIQIAKQLRKGLTNVIFQPNGTANSGLREKGGLAFLNELKQQGYQVYAKTGTLTEDGKNDTSRIILTILKFEDKDQTKVKIGLTFSLFVEETKQGTASVWLGEYLAQNKSDILRILNSN